MDDRRVSFATRSSLGAAIAGLCCLATSAAQAHHSAAMFDRNSTTTLSGPVIAFDWANPHCRLLLEVVDKGQKIAYNIEVWSPSLLTRKGWTRKTLAPGHKVTAKFHPMKDGSRGGELVGVTKPDGSFLSTPAPGL